MVSPLALTPSLKAAGGNNLTNTPSGMKDQPVIEVSPDQIAKLDLMRERTIIVRCMDQKYTFGFSDSNKFLWNKISVITPNKQGELIMEGGGLGNTYLIGDKDKEHSPQKVIYTASGSGNTATIVGGRKGTWFFNEGKENRNTILGLDYGDKDNGVYYCLGGPNQPVTDCKDTVYGSMLVKNTYDIYTHEKSKNNQVDLYPGISSVLRLCSVNAGPKDWSVSRKQSGKLTTISYEHKPTNTKVMVHLNKKTDTLKVEYHPLTKERPVIESYRNTNRRNPKSPTLAASAINERNRSTGATPPMRGLMIAKSKPMTATTKSPIPTKLS